MYSKINLENAEWKTRPGEPAVKTLGHELKINDEPRPNKMRFNYFHYNEGEVVRRHKQKEQEELFYIERGRGIMEVDGNEFEYEGGDVIVVDEGPWRQITAHEETRIFAVGAPNIRDDVVYEDELNEAE